MSRLICSPHYQISSPPVVNSIAPNLSLSVSSLWQPSSGALRSREESLNLVPPSWVSVTRLHCNITQPPVWHWGHTAFLSYHFLTRITRLNVHWMLDILCRETCVTEIKTITSVPWYSPAPLSRRSSHVSVVSLRDSQQSEFLWRSLAGGK